MKFYTADVFAEKPHAGNQLAVFLDAGGLSTEQMQTLALEMNLPESSFVTSKRERDGGWDVRIFTPRAELPFAGHPTLGTAFVIREALLPEPAQEVRLNLKVGQIPVRYRRDPSDGVERGVMTQRPPEFGEVIPHETAAGVLGLDLNDVDGSFPAQKVSTGLAHLIVPVKTLSAVKRARLDPARYDAMIRDHDQRTIFFFSRETYSKENDLNARMFAPAFGIAEDPATGSAAGCLAGYLVKHRFLGKPSATVRMEQGYEIDRPSLLFLESSEKDGTIEIQVGGRVFLTAKGELLELPATARD